MLLFLLYIWSNKYSFGKHKGLLSKTYKNFTTVVLQKYIDNNNELKYYFT